MKTFFVNLGKIIECKYLFYSLLLFNIILLCSTKFFPTIDGPAHVYNSIIIKELILGNELFADYFTFNYFFAPNWGTHLIMAILQFCFPALIVEKIFLILYISSMALSFRFLIKQINPEALSLSIFIFPAIYTFLFYCGFYNFSFSFVLLFFTLGLWIKFYPSIKRRYWILFSLLLIFTYYTNILTLAFLGISMGLYAIYYTYNFYQNKQTLKELAKKMTCLLVAALPSLILVLIFYTHIQFQPVQGNPDWLATLKMVGKGRALVVYYDTEIKNTIPIVILLLIILGISFIKKREDKWLTKADIILIPALITLFLLFTTHPDAQVGMMDIRYCTIFFILSTLWIIGRAKNIKINAIFIVLVIFFHIRILLDTQESIELLNENAHAVYNSANHIEENSLVLPVLLDVGWVEGHIYSYVGYHKNVLLLRNYEACLKWFPIRLKDPTLSSYYHFEKVKDFISNDLPGDYQEKYLLIIDKGNRLIDTTLTEFNEMIEQSCTLQYGSTTSFASLYKIKQ